MQLLSAVPTEGPNPFPPGMPASIVLGQANFTGHRGSSGGRTSASELSPVVYATAFDGPGDLWVADYNNNRVLEFPAPLRTHEPAAIVLGQATLGGWASGTGAANLSGPDGLAFDPAGDLWVSDFGNNRVLEFVPPFSSGDRAASVLGQSNASGSLPGNGPRNFSGPAGLAFSGSDLWVCDYYSNRVVEFRPPFSNGSAAVAVLGQSNLSGYLGGVSARNLTEPSGLVFDPEGGVWVSDSGNDRVVDFSMPLVTNDSATRVFGQSTLNARGLKGPDSLSSPGGVTIDPQGSLWVADTGHNRTLEFRLSNATNGEAPTTVLGQSRSSTFGPNATATGEDGPTAVVFDPTGDAWVTDSASSRILGYLPTRFNVTFEGHGLSAGAGWSVRVGNSTYPTSSGGSVTLVLTNGTYRWNLTSTPPGFQAPVSNGTATVNGTSVLVEVYFRPFSYPVVFRALGLPAGTSWTVSLGGSASASTSEQVLFNESNGSYAFEVTPPIGYLVSPRTGVVPVHGDGASVALQFSSISGAAPATPPLLPGGPLLWAFVSVGVVFGLVLVWVLRRRRAPPGPSECIAQTPPESGAPREPAMGEDVPMGRQ